MEFKLCLSYLQVNPCLATSFYSNISFLYLLITVSYYLYLIFFRVQILEFKVTVIKGNGFKEQGSCFI